MKFTQLSKIAPICYKQGITLHLKSKPGMGKSEWVENELPEVIKQALGVPTFDVMTMSLTSMDAPDIRGYTIPVKRESDGKMITRSTESPLMPRAEEGHGEYGALFLDEYGQAPQDVAKPTAPVILDGRAGDDQLPKGWMTILASNRMADKAGVNRPMSHIVNRTMEVEVEFDLDSWTQWAYKTNVDPLFIAFARFQPAIICEDVPTNPEPFCTPRSFSRFAEFTADYCGGEVHDGVVADTCILEAGCGMLGKGAATSALAFMRVAADLPTYQQVLDSPDSTAKAIPRDRMDVVHSATTMVTARCEVEHIEPVFQFITNLPIEFQTATLRNLMDKMGPKALQHPTFQSWVQKNSAMISASFSS